MPRYMLDTDTCSYVMKRSSDVLLKRLKKTPVSDVCISVITKSELLYGVEVSPRRQQDDSPHRIFALCRSSRFSRRGGATLRQNSCSAEDERNHDWSQRPFYSRPRAQPWPHTCHEQYA